MKELYHSLSSTQLNFRPVSGGKGLGFSVQKSLKALEFCTVPQKEYEPGCRLIIEPNKRVTSVFGHCRLRTSPAFAAARALDFINCYVNAADAPKTNVRKTRA